MDKPEEQKSGGMIDNAEKWLSDAYHSVANTVKAHPGETALGVAGTAAVVAGVVLAPEVTLPALAIGGTAVGLTGCTFEASTEPVPTAGPAPRPDVCAGGPPLDAIIVDNTISSPDYPFNAIAGDRIEVTNGVVDTAPGSITWVDPYGTVINDGGIICAAPGALVIQSETGAVPGLVVESLKTSPASSLKTESVPAKTDASPATPAASASPEATPAAK